MAESGPEIPKQHPYTVRMGLRRINDIGGFVTDLTRQLELAKGWLDKALPLEAPDGMYFAVRPIQPQDALTVQVRVVDGTIRQELFTKGGRTHATEVLETHGPIRRDPDRSPVFVGTTIVPDDELPGRCCVVSEDGLVSVLYSPEINSIRLVEAEDLPQ